ncbi:MAG TPA: hypothetical protein VHW45_20200 [Candidatus Sulfotelmatobacter sp.]|jgi:hypothetical protein|nr:hypothetical protein [Candidatus Sulfotelmatobacter sp.]
MACKLKDQLARQAQLNAALDLDKNEQQLARMTRQNPIHANVRAHLQEVDEVGKNSSTGRLNGP